jgi:DNA excision repair protein ERCC-5
LNKQGNLNEFFDITAGSGTYAPRKRHGYASKRLQHVVSEFRSAQAKYQDRGVSPSTAPDEEGADIADAHVKKRAKTATRTKGKNRAVKNSKASRSSSKSRTSPNSESDSEGDMYQGERGAQESPPPLRVELRPRRKGTNSDGIPMRTAHQ